MVQGGGHGRRVSQDERRDVTVAGTAPGAMPSLHPGVRLRTHRNTQGCAYFIPVGLVPATEKAEGP